jgi:hemerythrin HHE cation binding domain-containing protein
MTDALDKRDGLPGEFRYLEPGCPRSAWPTIGLHPTAQHWLEVHGWFRGQMTDLVDLGGHWREGRISASDYRLAATPRVRHLLNNLHHHHNLESHHAFPLLSAAEPGMAKGFALLDRDHDAIEHLLSSIAGAANVLIQAGREPGDLSPHAASLSDHIDRGTTLIGRHLWDEEEIVVPVLTLRGDSVAI